MASGSLHSLLTELQNNVNKALEAITARSVEQAADGASYMRERIVGANEMISQVLTTAACRSNKVRGLFLCSCIHTIVLIVLVHVIIMWFY